MLWNYDYSNSTASAYLDGTLVGTSTIANDQIADGQICIGAKSTTDGGDRMGTPTYYAGARIYNRALTSAEIAELAGEF